MPSTRRFKLLMTAIAIIIFLLFYLSDESSTSEFYSKTVAAMDRDSSSTSSRDSKSAQRKDDVAHGQKASKDRNDGPSPIAPVKGQELEAILVAPDDKSVKPDKDGGKSVAGRKKFSGGERWDVATGKEAPVKDKVKDSEDENGEKGAETEEEHEIEAELNGILKKGPIIIFSKSYCPYSKKAKDILLEKYTIVPTPHVVELDEHRLGPSLQAALEKSTGRRTVPNVLINGKSIGGGDDVQKLDIDGELVAKVKSMGGKRIMEAKVRGA